MLFFGNILDRHLSIWEVLTPFLPVNHLLTIWELDVDMGNLYITLFFE